VAGAVTRDDARTPRAGDNAPSLVVPGLVADVAPVLIYIVASLNARVEPETFL